MRRTIVSCLLATMLVGCGVSAHDPNLSEAMKRIDAILRAIEAYQAANNTKDYPADLSQLIPHLEAKGGKINLESPGTPGKQMIYLRPVPGQIPDRFSIVVYDPTVYAGGQRAYGRGGGLCVSVPDPEFQAQLAKQSAKPAR